MKVQIAQLCPALCDPMAYIVHGILQARIQEQVAIPFSRGSSQPGIEPRSPTLQADSLPVEPQGKSKNTGVGSLFLLPGIFPTQELNRGFLHCRWILYHLSICRLHIEKVKVFQSSLTLQPCGLFSPQNSPGQNTEGVAFPISRGSSQPRDQTQVSHIAGGFFTI